MGAYNRVKETPRYSVTRKKQVEIKDGEYKLLHIGLYQSKKYGLTAYADIDTGEEKPSRFSLPKRSISEIDEVSHSDAVMRAIHDGSCMLRIKHITTKTGNETIKYEVYEK